MTKKVHQLLNSLNERLDLKMKIYFSPYWGLINSYEIFLAELAPDIKLQLYIDLRLGQ